MENSVHDDNTVYVAIGTKVEESMLALSCAIQNLSPTKVVILHVLRPISTSSNSELYILQGAVKDHILTTLDAYVEIFQKSGVQAEKLCIEMDGVEKGILELIHRHAIKKLLTGAGSDCSNSGGVDCIKSKKAKYILKNAPPSCQVWFFDSHGDLIFSRVDVASSSVGGEHGTGTELCEVRESGENSSDENLVNELYEELEQGMMESEKYRREAFEESLRRWEDEKKSIRSTFKVLESLYANEVNRRKQIEEALKKEQAEHNATKNQSNEDRVIALDQQMLMVVQNESLENKVNKLENELRSLVIERNMLRVEHEIALKLCKEMFEIPGEGMHRQLSVFSLSEIDEATQHFDVSLKIGEGGYGSIYKGFIRHTAVAIKVLNPNSMQGTIEFQQEVNVLSKLRHPNLVTLIGACPEAHALVYEYLPNGNLEDRLRCKGNCPPLSWKARIRIATELCSALIFLHSSTPESIVHGDLKPDNVLLDNNFSCKLGDFGICRALSLRSDSSTLLHFTDPKGTFHYIDPHFFITGELTPKADTFSFGIIILQLLTGKRALGLIKEMTDVVNQSNLSSVLDTSAGDWPFVQANQLAQLALRCCAIDRSCRPDLATEVWRVLQPMQSACLGSSLSSSSSQQPPSYFTCPIFQEVMKDPHVAADGFTYEAEGIKGWFDNGRDTSPMTNLKLDHLNLVPNHSLRSAIQEWQEQQLR